MIYLTKLISISTTATQLIPKISHDIFNWHSILVLVVVMFVTWVIGKLVSIIFYRLSSAIGRTADRTQDLARVNRLRRTETVLILVSALVRAIFIILGLYVWWALTHPTQLTALIGASALLLLMLANLSSPIFRDLALGGGMMAEKWYGVGDLVRLQPNNVQGIVEHVTLRSTRIRSLSGEAIWVANQNISMVEVVPKGVHTIAIELFMSDKDRAKALIEETNKLIPTGTSLVVTPLAIMNTEQVDDHIWHLTVIAEAAPWRDDLITTSAIDVLKNLDKKHKPSVLLAEPVARVADSAAEKEFARAINNSRKTNRVRSVSSVAVSKVVKSHR